MANLASEFERVVASKNNEDASFAVASLARADRILAEIKKMPDMVAREQEVDLLSYAIHKGDEPDQLRSYFEPLVSRLFASQAQSA